MLNTRDTDNPRPGHEGSEEADPPICGYSVDPDADDCDLSLGNIEGMLEDGVWRCRRRPNPGMEHCPFHQDPEERRNGGPAGRDGISDAELSQMFLALIRDERDTALIEDHDRTDPDAEWPFLSIVPAADESQYGDAIARRRKQFLGAQFGALELSYESFDAPDQYPIDLRGSIADTVDWANARLPTNVLLDSVSVVGRVSLWNADVDGEVSLEGADVDYVSLVDADVDGEILLRYAEVDGSVTLGGADVVEPVYLRDADVDGGVSLDGADVGGVSLPGADVGGVSLDGADVGGSVTLGGADVVGPVSLRSAEVDGRVSLRSAEVDGSVTLEDADVVGSVLLRDVEVDGRVTLEEADLVRKVSLRHVEVDHDVSLRYADVDWGVYLEDADVDYVSLVDADVDENILLEDVDVGGSVTLEGADVVESVFLRDVEVDGRVTLEEADVDGNVSLRGADIHEMVNISVATVLGTLQLKHTRIRGDLICSRASIGQETEASNVALALSGTTADDRELRASIGGAVSFTHTKIHGTLAIGHAGPTVFDSSLELSEVDAQTLDFSADALIHPAVRVVNLTDADITNVTLRPSTGTHPLVYDFQGATIGAIGLRGYAADDLGIPEYDIFRFVDTTFEGFEFSRHRQELLAIDWALHQVVQNDDHRDGELDVRIGQALRDSEEDESARDAVIESLDEYLGESKHIEAVIECLSKTGRAEPVAQYLSASQRTELIQSEVNERRPTDHPLNADEKALDVFALTILLAQSVLAERLPEDGALTRFVQRLEAAEAERRVACRWEPTRARSNDTHPDSGDTGLSGLTHASDGDNDDENPDESLVGDHTTPAQEDGRTPIPNGGDGLTEADSEGTTALSEPAHADENRTDTDDPDCENGPEATQLPDEHRSRDDGETVALDENETPPDDIAELFAERLADAVRAEQQNNDDLDRDKHAPDSDEYGYAKQGDRELLTRLRARANMETGPGNPNAGAVGNSDDENETAATFNRIVGRFREAVGSLRHSSRNTPSGSSSQSGVEFPSYSVDDGLQEATYSKAKTAANEVGADDAASQFFIREQRAAERQERKQFWKGSPFRSDTDLSSWIKRAFSPLQRIAVRYLTLYGERPRRVLGWWAVTILACWALYYVWLTPVLSGPALQPSRIIDAGLLSVGSFATLLPRGERTVALSDGNTLPDTLVLIAEMQALTGVLLLSLFVFTLSRSVRR